MISEYDKALLNNLLGPGGMGESLMVSFFC